MVTQAHRTGCRREDHPQIDRRSLLQVGGMSLVGCGLSDLMRLESQASPSPRLRGGTAKAVVFIFQSGGPSQHETFDPKPTAPDTIRGEYGTTATRLPSIHFCEYLPRLAALADRFSIVRTMHHLAGREFRNEHNSCHYLLHTGTTFVAQAPLEYTLPRHVDTVATRFPDVKIIMAHLGHPYEGECIATFRKHPNVYADVSALHYRSFQLYHSLMLVQEYGVWHKVLFGTDYPFTTVTASVDGIRKLNDMLEGTKLPRLNPEQIEKMIYRDSLAILGLT